MDVLQFENAIERSENFTRLHANEELLQLHAQYKQTTAGDVYGEKPGGLDFIVKFDVWASLIRKPEEETMLEYVTFVDKVQQQYA